jgi:hypothetical protein
MRARVAVLLTLVVLAALMAGCEGLVTHLPTPTGAGPILPGQPAPGATPQPALLEQRLIILEWPLKVREKDSALILLTIAVDEQGRLTATAQSDGGFEPVPVDIPNIYDTHNLVAVARLDMAGVEAYREAIREPLRPGRPVTFRWSIRANEAGLYRGVVWLHLELVPIAGGPLEQQLLLARTIEVQAVTVFGLPGGLARGLGALGLVASTLLGYPFIQRLIDAWLKGRKKAPPKRLPPQADGPESEEVGKAEQ